MGCLKQIDFLCKRYCRAWCHLLCRLSSIRVDFEAPKGLNLLWSQVLATINHFHTMLSVIKSLMRESSSFAASYSNVGVVAYTIYSSSPIVCSQLRNFPRFSNTYLNVRTLTFTRLSLDLEQFVNRKVKTSAKTSDSPCSSICSSRLSWAI